MQVGLSQSPVPQNLRKNVGFGEKPSENQVQPKVSTSLKVVSGGLGAATGGIIGVSALDLFSRVISKTVLSLAILEPKPGVTEKQFINHVAEGIMKTPAKYCAIGLGALMGAGSALHGMTQRAKNLKKES